MVAGKAASFLQVGSSSRHREGQVLRMLEDSSEEHPDSPALQLLATRVAHVAKQSHHSKKGFSKIQGLIDNMIRLLGKEGNDDKIKKEMCVVYLAKNTEKKGNLETGIKSKAAEVANLKDNLAVVTKDMAKMRADLAELDKTVKQATSQRKEENQAFTQMLSETNQAVGILEVARKRLKSYYGGAFLQQSDNVEEAPSFLQEDDSESSDDSKGEYSFMEASGHQKRQRKPQSGGSKIVLQMLATIQTDLKNEFQTAKKEETDAQASYEELLNDAKKKREVSARGMTQKEGVKAGLQEEIKKNKDRITGLSTELKETIDVIEDLHDECDFLLKNFQERVKLRGAEVESLNRAKSTLAGAK